MDKKDVINVDMLPNMSASGENVPGPSKPYNSAYRYGAYTYRCLYNLCYMYYMFMML